MFAAGPVRALGSTLTSGFALGGDDDLQFTRSAREGGTDTTEAGAQARFEVAGPSGCLPKSRMTLRSTIGADYANGRLADKFERLPRCAAGRWRVGVRAILENSTACQKSMPSLISFLWVAFGLSHGFGFFFG